MPYYSAILNPIFKPAVRDILSITQSFPATVTTTYDGMTPGPHNYISGLIVRMNIPLNYGMVLLNKKVSAITVTSPTTFTINIDTTNFDPFVIPVEMGNQPLANVAQVNAYGELAQQLDGAFVNTLTPLY